MHPTPIRTAAHLDRSSRRGVTLIEIIAVIGIIVILAAILVPALAVARGNAIWGQSQSNLRQTFILMQGYVTDNREYIVPAAFDYTNNPSPGRARSAPPAGAVPPIGGDHGRTLTYGPWSDILWTLNDSPPLIMNLPVLAGPNGHWNYKYDSPDRFVFQERPGFSTIFRSAAELTTAPGGEEATPFGDGARLEEVGQPGYFAANSFFDARPTTAEPYGVWWTMPQIKRPAQTTYLVDSTHGEIIPGGTAANADIGYGSEDNSEPGQVDFRYVGDVALMLMLDGHVESRDKWADWRDLEGIRLIDQNR